MKRKRFYAAMLLALFVCEVLIAVYGGGIVWLRSYGGDVLVMPLIYCLIRLFTDRLPRAMPALVFGIGLIAEITQYFHLSDLLGFPRGSLMSILLGTSASWWDVLSYAIGILPICLFTFLKRRRSS